MTENRTQTDLTGSRGNNLETIGQGISAPWEDLGQNEAQSTDKKYRYEKEHHASPEDIDLSAFHTPQRRKTSPYATAILTIMFVAILAAGYGITKTIKDMNGTNSWQKDYVLEETKKGINDKYNIVGAKNSGNTVQLLLEQTSDDKEVTAKVTVVFYNSQNIVLDAQSGNGTMHGKGTNCIIEIPTKVSGFDHMNIISEE